MHHENSRIIIGEALKYMYEFIDMYMHVCTYICKYGWVYVCMYVCTYVCMYAHTCMYDMGAYVCICSTGDIKLAISMQPRTHML